MKQRKKKKNQQKNQQVTPLKEEIIFAV